MTTYVCGFLFNPTLDRVVLIQKNRGPRHMAGHLNGIGGKVELGESARSAQSREFLEETGLYVPIEDWMCFHTERYYLDSANTVHFMCALSPHINKARTTEDEEVAHVVVINGQLKIGPDWRVMYNLPYLIPMAQCWLKSPLDRYFES